jgi:hypothetical protein
MSTTLQRIILCIRLRLGILWLYNIENNWGDWVVSMISIFVCRICSHDFESVCVTVIFFQVWHIYLLLFWHKTVLIRCRPYFSAETKLSFKYGVYCWWKLYYIIFIINCEWASTQWQWHNTIHKEHRQTTKNTSHKLTPSRKCKQ